jgi:hypothetical protein
MQLDELIAIIQGAGGGGNAIDYAQDLLIKLERLEDSGGYEALIAQLRSAKDQGDFRGRLLEVNFADLFVEKKLKLAYGVKQGMGGDVDFCWDVAGYNVFIETKLLGQDKATRDSFNQQLDKAGVAAAFVTEDTRDLARIQFDLFQKSSTTKFNPKPQDQWINLVAVDVAELQLGMIDLCDCLLAVGGNTLAKKCCHRNYLRPRVVGVFESIPDKQLTADQKSWIGGVHKWSGSTPHPQDYMHGVLFLFREPKARAALSYSLSGLIVWNCLRIPNDIAHKIGHALHEVIPLKSFALRN